MRPVVLGANTPRSFYRGVGRIHRFRGVPVPDDAYLPEDWIASTTARYGQDPAGITVLPDGRRLAAAIAADPEGWLGPGPAARSGADPRLLVKLLDAGQRLPLHAHPDGAFAAGHLASPHGKTEAWVIVEAVPDAYVHLGFAREVPAADLSRWVRDQDVPAMLAATNRVPVRAGDAVFVPAGLPHAIGPGVLIVEVQEPTDLSVLLEREGFAVPEPDALLGLDREVALSCVDRTGWDSRRLAGLRGTARPGGRPGVARLLPAAADGYFGAELLRPDPVAVLDPGFCVLVVVAGRGVLRTGDVALPVARGSTLVIPYAAGTGELTGDVEAVRCRPPE